MPPIPLEWLLVGVLALGFLILLVLRVFDARVVAQSSITVLSLLTIVGMLLSISWMGYEMGVLGRSAMTWMLYGGLILTIGIALLLVLRRL